MVALALLVAFVASAWGIYLHAEDYARAIAAAVCIVASVVFAVDDFLRG